MALLRLIRLVGLLVALAAAIGVLGASAAAQGDGGSGSVDLDLFLDGALNGEPTVDECTLSDGTVSRCYTITVVGTPVNHDVGPFCPTTITDGPEAGGLWLDGQSSYTIDGPFFTQLASIYGDVLWNNIYNDDGSINVIDNAADFQVAARPDITEEFYYHCVDGDVAWVNGGIQPMSSIQVPVTPVRTDSATTEFATGAHSTLGVTLNGAGLSGSADMGAILSSYTIAAFDDCGGHINPALGYHVHGTAGCSDVGNASTGETAPFAIAIDGHTIHGPLGNGTTADLDECNGHTTEQFGYHYHANSIEENATLTCVTGLTIEAADGEGRPDRPEPPTGGPPDGGPPAGEAPPAADQLEAASVDLDRFFDGAIVESSIVDCTLTDGTTTTCYSITIAGDPVTYETGPFCPATINDDASAGGIWFDGNGVYDVDGAFILSLADLYNDDNWMLYDADGNVNVTETAEEFEAAARPNVDPSLQNHCVEGRVEFLPDGLPVTSTVTIPTDPIMTGRATVGRGNLGVTLDGVVIAASAPVEAILGAYTIAAFDDCGGHYNPVEGYHMHGATGCSESGEVPAGETPMFAYALDGVPVHSAMNAADLDQCNGHTTDELGYHYHANPAETNLVVQCLMGATVAAGAAPAAPLPVVTATPVASIPVVTATPVASIPVVTATPVAVTTQAQPTATAAAPLALTGTRSTTLAMIGLALVGIGAAIVGISKRRSARD